MFKNARFADVFSVVFIFAFLFVGRQSSAVDIPLDNIQPLRIGYVDLQKVFDTFPEKSFAEGDLLKEIDRRRRELSKRQNDIGALRLQISADQSVLTQAKAGQSVIVPANSVPEIQAPVAAPAQTVSASSGTVHGSTTPVVEPYPTEDPLAGLPGHEGALNPTDTKLPGMKDKNQMSVLDELATASSPAPLTPEAMDSLQRRINGNQKRLDRSVAEFRNFRINAIADMKVLQTEKTYDVMSKIYAILEQLAHDENITVVIDKSYILYGEEGVDLSERLMARLQQAEGIQ